MKRNYIGLACSWHDPALAIVDSRGEVVFAEGAERSLQRKRGLNFPADDVMRIQPLIEEYCEPDADLVVSRSWRLRSARKSWLATLGVDLVESLLKAPSALRGRGAATAHPTLALARYSTESHGRAARQASSAVRYAVHWTPIAGYVARSREAAAAGDRSFAADVSLPRRGLHQVDFDHHLSHAAASCYASPFSQAVCAVVDGYGESGSTSFFSYRDGKIAPIDKRQKSRTSIGVLYTVICLACGFEPMWGEEWKVMGLAPSGQIDGAILALLEEVLEVRDLRFLPNRDPRSFRRLVEKLSKFPAADVARTGQAFFERCMTKLMNHLAERSPTRNLVLTGGCALNSSANGKLLDETPFDNLYVYCAPGDDGNAVGAALLAHRRDHPGSTPDLEVASPYLGSEISRGSVENMLRLGRPPGHSSWPGTIHRKAAQLLSEGKIIGWVQGRAEFGPRALGNRSILADPRRPEIKDLLNERVKFREEFRPFAPSILHEFGDEYFESYRESPYMERTLRFREAVKSKVPGVVHVDGTGRLQTVKREWNERYHELIAEFHRLTGVPLVLNTSFNVMGKPIIHSVEDAMAVFYTSGLDALIIHDELIEKEPLAAAAHGGGEDAPTGAHESA